MDNQKKNDMELMHYGVPGMKWGVRKSFSDPVGTSHRAKNSQKQIVREMAKKSPRLQKKS